jgi:hypothetical protein
MSIRVLFKSWDDIKSHIEKNYVVTHIRDDINVKKENGQFVYSNGFTLTSKNFKTIQDLMMQDGAITDWQ